MIWLYQSLCSLHIVILSFVYVWFWYQSSIYFGFNPFVNYTVIWSVYHHYIWSCMDIQLSLFFRSSLLGWPSLNSCPPSLGHFSGQVYLAGFHSIHAHPVWAIFRYIWLVHQSLCSLDTVNLSFIYVWFWSVYHHYIWSCMYVQLSLWSIYHQWHVLIILNL